MKEGEATNTPGKQEWIRSSRQRLTRRLFLLLPLWQAVEASKKGSAAKDITEARAKTLRGRSCPIPPRSGWLAGWQLVTDAVLILFLDGGTWPVLDCDMMRGRRQHPCQQGWRNVNQEFRESRIAPRSGNVVCRGGGRELRLACPAATVVRRGRSGNQGVADERAGLEAGETQPPRTRRRVALSIGS